MNLYQVTFDTSTVFVLAQSWEQLYIILKDLDSKYKATAGILFYWWDDKTYDRCDIKKINLNVAGIVSAVAH